MRYPIQQDNGGLLLIVLSALLTLLTLLAVVLVSATSGERAASGIRLDDVRARMLTRTGVEFAVAKLRKNPEPKLSGAVDPSEDWVYRDRWDVPLAQAKNPSYHAGEPWIDLLPNGKYDEGTDAWNPDQDWNGNGRYDGWSGRVRGTYQSYGETFKLRIEGNEAKINLNGGFLDGEDRDINPDGSVGDGVPDHRDTWVSKWVDGWHPYLGTREKVWDIGRGWNGQLTRLLDNLVEGLLPAVGLARENEQNPVIRVEQREENPFLPPARSAETLGTWLISRRPEGGFQNWEEVAQAVLEGASGADSGTLDVMSELSWTIPAGSEWVDLLRTHMTLRSWSDRVIHPHDVMNNFEHIIADTEGLLKDVPGGHYGPRRGFSPAQLRRFAGPPEMELRSPIQVNLASPEVLTSAMTDLAPEGMRFENFDRIPFSVAQRVSVRIAQLRQGEEDQNENGRMEPGEDRDQDRFLDAPFRSWYQWNAFCDELGVVSRLQGQRVPVHNDLQWLPYDSGGLVDQRPLERRARILKQHFNPNGHAAFGVADHNLQELLQTSGPEVNYTPPSLYQKSQIVTYSTEWTFEPPRSFSIESFGSVEGAGGETRSQRGLFAEWELFGLYRADTQEDFVGGRGSPASYGSESSRFHLATAGAALGWHSPGRGVTVMTYPEPSVRLPKGASSYDGYIGLATIEEIPDGTQTFLHHFDDGWNADAPSGSPALVDMEEAFRLRDRFPERSLWDRENPGTLYPDGGGVEVEDGQTRDPGNPPVALLPWRALPLFSGREDRIPVFDVDGNVPAGGRYGAVGMWVKPLIKASYSFQMLRSEGERTQILLMGMEQTGGTRNGNSGIVVENRMTSSHDWSLYTSDGNNNEGEYHGGFSHSEYDRTPDGSGGMRERKARLRGGGYANETESAREAYARWQFRAAHWNLEEDRMLYDVMFWRGEIGQDRVPFLKEAASLVGSGVNYSTGFDTEGVTDWRGERLYLGSVGAPQGSDVIDEVAVYDFGPDAKAALSDAGGVQWMVNRRWEEGRYYKWDDAVFTSPGIPLGSARIKRISWTVIPPKIDKKLIEHAKVTVRLSGATEGTEEMDNEAGNPMDLRTWGPVRYHVRFDPLADPEMLPQDRDKYPVLESPFFDDILIFYELPGGSVTRYEER